MARQAKARRKAEPAGDAKGRLAKLQALFAERHFDAAATAAKTLLVREPTNGEAKRLLVLALLAQGLFDQAAAAHAGWRGARPGSGPAVVDWVRRTMAEGHRDRAADCLRQFAGADEALLGNLCDLAAECCRQSRFADAVMVARTVTASPKATSEGFNILGAALRALGQLDEAVAVYQRALQIDPDNSQILYNLGNLFREAEKTDLAVTQYCRAINANAQFASSYLNLGNVLIQQAKLVEACDVFQLGLQADPAHAVMADNLLGTLNYRDDVDPETVYDLHRYWAQRQADQVPRTFSHANAPVTDRTIRIGILSADLREHSITYFLEPLLEHCDRSRLEFIGYHTGTVEDATSARLRALATDWRRVSHQSDAALADIIRADAIDILIELSGHTRGNRLPVCARKPAPVVMTWLGYPNTTGLADVDYRLTDAIVDPPGTDRLYTEALVRLPDPFLCYRPPDTAPPVTPPPCLEKGFITFGSFNNPMKITPTTCALWARILMSVPNSRLWLKGRYFSCDTTRAKYIKYFVAAGVEESRLVIEKRIDATTDHLQRYSEIDIALDTYPYNGTTTTCEALWMGVPVISRRGDTHASRVGATLLAGVGLDDFVAGTDFQYLTTAIALAGSRDRLAEFRSGMRDRLRTSRLCDAPRFAQAMGSALTEAWRRWCATQPRFRIAGTTRGDGPAALFEKR